MPSPALRPARRAATPMAFVQAIVRGYERRGADPSKALTHAHIAPGDLADPQGRVTAAQFEALSGFAMQELDDEALGWFERRLPWGSYGMLCRASLNSPNLGVAIKRWCRHHLLLTDDIALELKLANGAAHVSIRETRALGDLREFCLVSSLRFLHGFASWAIDSRVSLRDASFPYPAPPHGDAYPLMFGGDLHFEAARAGYSFDERYLALPLARDEQALRTMLRRALPLTVLQYRRDRLLGQRVRELLRTLGSEAATADSLGARLNLSARTLHRQLLEEGPVASGVEGRGASGARDPATAEDRKVHQADRTERGISKRKELFARVSRLDGQHARRVSTRFIISEILGLPCRDKS